MRPKALPFWSAPETSSRKRIMAARAPATDRATARTIWLVAALLVSGLGLRLFHILWRFNQCWEPDSIEHVFFIERSLSDLPQSLTHVLSVWAKPLFTAFFASLYALWPAEWPFLPLVQAVNALFWLVTALMQWDVARRNGRADSSRSDSSPWALVAFMALLAFDFTYFRSSVSALTEPIGALAVATSFWLLSRHRPYLSTFVLGLSVLCRIDALLFVGTQVAYLAWREKNETWPQRARQILEFGALGFLPVVTWNLLGYGVTGEPLFLLTKGYPTQAGVYGFGDPFYYFRIFSRTDKVFLVAFWVGVVAHLAWLRNGRRSRKTLTTLAVAQSTAYFLVLSALWVKGAFGLAGLARYFVVAIPYFLFVGFTALTWLDAVLANGKRRAFVTAVLLGVLAWDLGHIFREPKYRDGQWTALPARDPFAALGEIKDRFRDMTIHTDRPEVLFYLRHDRHHPTGSVEEVRDPAKKGVFVYVKEWSEVYSGLTAQDFAGIPLAHQEREIYVHVRR